MTGIVTCADLDVHARSTHAAAIDVETGEVVRARFGAGIEEPVAWLRNLRAPVPAARNRALGSPILASSDWQRRHRARRPGLPTTPNARHADAITPAHLMTNTTLYQLSQPRRSHIYS